MVSIDDLKELTLYKKPFYLPINAKDKKKGASIMLLTPNYKSSMLAMTAPYAINRRYYESYYVEKSITRFIRTEKESMIEPEDPGEYIFEETLSSKERKELKDSDFGLPSQRRYPMPDESHVLSAIRFFNHVEEEYEKELASNIIKKIKEFDMADKVHVGDKNRFKPYWEKSGLALKESSIIENDSEDISYEEYISENSIDSLNVKFKNEYNLIFNGYKKDIEIVKEIISKRKLIKTSFEAIEEKIPKTINIDVIGDPNSIESYSKNSFTILSKSAYSKAENNSISYNDYVKFIVQLFAIYTIKTMKGKYVLSSLAEPAALLLSNIADSKLDSIKYKDHLIIERVFSYVIKTYGFNEFKRILRYNDTTSVLKYTKEFSTSIKSESVNLMIEENSILEKEETILTEDMEVPASIKAIQNLGKNLKRRIRQNSIYKLNKIARDIEKGNIGAETRDQSSFEKIKSGNIVDLSALTKEQLERYTDGDYILEGNIAYIFEDNLNYDALLRKTLWADRFRTDKQVLEVYKTVKNDLPFIKFAYVNPQRYSGKNVFIDLSRYNESFFRNMINLNDEERANTKKLFKIYMELMSRLLKNDVFGPLNGYKKQTIFIPVLDWRHNDSTKMWMYKQDINPISVIYQLMRTDLQTLKRTFGNRDIVFLGAKNYFKVNFSKTDFSNMKNINTFTKHIRRIIDIGYNGIADPDPEGEFEDSPKGIAMDIIDKVEHSQGVEINNVSPIENLNSKVDLFNKNNAVEDKNTKVAIKKLDQSSRNTLTATQPAKVVSKSQAKADTGVANDTVSVNTTSEEQKKDAIVDAITKAAQNASDTNDALDKLDNDEFKKIITDLQNDNTDNARVDKTRASAIIAKEDEFHKKEVDGKSVRDLLDVDPSTKQLQKTELKVSSINDDWNNMTFINFDKDYDLDSDIVKMLDSMKYWTFPIAVKNIDIKDNSTSEDILDLWTIDCVDYKNTKFTLKVDIPRFINGSNFLKLRGNEKTLMIQSTLLPIIKTDEDECQIIGSGGYNKIFVRRFGSRVGQSLSSSSKLLRALNKYTKDHKDIKIIYGDASRICSKYELPIDYIDLSNSINSIETKWDKIFFNQDDFRKQYVVDDTKGLPIGISKGTNGSPDEIIYYDSKIQSTYSTVASFIASILGKNKTFQDLYTSMITTGNRNTYSKASILSTEIPIVVICGYLEGLIKTLKKAGIKYEFVQDIDRTLRQSDQKDYIRFKNGYLVYDVNYSSSLLLNGLKSCTTEDYNIEDINDRRMWLDYLDEFSTKSSTIVSDGLENFYDCMIDPITKEILEKFKLPTDFVGALLHANNLLADNKYVKHVDQAGRRWRRKELIAGYFYNALTSAYQSYANSNRHNRRSTKMSMKQSAVIDLILSKDPAMSDLSVNNVLNDVECANTVTNKGLVGMNVQRGYTKETRGYDESMLNLLGMDTGFSGNVGINRQATIDANIEGGRGFVKTIEGDSDKLSIAKTMTMTEAVTPLGTTHDDPPRTLMTYVQTSKHMIRCNNNDPTLVTTGADEALPYISSDIFAYKAKHDGTIIELVQEGPYKNNYMVIEYKDGSHDYVNLSEEVKKNSDGGYFVPLKLDTDLKLGSKVKAGDIVAYDKLSFSKSLGESGNLAVNIGTLAKVAIINTDEGYEDSAAITESFAKKIGTDVIMNIESKVDKGSNIKIYKNIGDKVMEGDTLFSYQQDFEDEVSNTLLKNLTMDAETLSELGSKPIKSKYTGEVAAIEIYRTCDLDEMSESLRKFVLRYESNIKKTKSVYNKYGIDPSMLPPTSKVAEVGKTKNLDDAVLITYYIKYNDTMSVGDKIVFYSANKGIVRAVIPEEDEPYTEFRPNESIDTFMSLSSISARMTASIPLMAATSKLMIELDRSVKDIAGIPYDESKL